MRLSWLTPDQWHIVIVESLTERETELHVDFVGEESAIVHSGVSNFPLMQQYLSLGLLYSLPLGVMVGRDKQVYQVGTAICAEVFGTSDHPHHQHVKNVELGGEAAAKYLSTQHPRFAELMQQINEATITRQSLWCILQGSSIVDIKELSPDEEQSLALVPIDDQQRSTR